MATITENQRIGPEGVLLRIVLIAAIVIGLSHTASWSAEMSEPLRLFWRFASVGTLALYAALHARDLNGWLLTAVMLISAGSDVLLVIVGRDFGAMCFIVADFIAILLYYRNFRPNLGAGSYLGAAMFVGGVSLASYLLPTDRGDAIIVAIFVVPLATMTALTFLTRFSPWLVGLGTLLILLSDLLIFRRMGPIECMAGLREAIWLCYFVGEALVVYGVTRGLMRTRASKFSRSD